MKTYKSSIDLVSLVRETTETKKAKIVDSNSAADYIRQFFPSDLSVREHFYCLYLNQANNTIGYQHISTGGIVGTVVDIRIILKGGLDCLATGIILVHNHPSGNLKPSNADKQVTEKLRTAAKFMDIKVLDHIILSDQDYLSFADQNLL